MERSYLFGQSFPLAAYGMNQVAQPVPTNRGGTEMRIGLAAPIFEPVPPVRHGGMERTVAMLAAAGAQCHRVCEWRFADASATVYDRPSRTALCG
jgi:hypothetical protein